MKLILGLTLASTPLVLALANSSEVAADAPTPTSSAVVDDPSPVPDDASVADDFLAIMIDSDLRRQGDEQIVEAATAFFAGLTPDLVAERWNLIHSKLGTSTEDNANQPALFQVYDDSTDVAFDEKGRAFALNGLELYKGATSVFDLCARVPETCEIVQIASDTLSDVTCGTFRGKVEELELVGVYCNASFEGAASTVLTPLAIVSDDSLLNSSQLGQLLVYFLDEAFPQDLAFLFESDSSAQASGQSYIDPKLPSPYVECLDAAGKQCLADRLAELMGELERINRDYKADYNALLEAAQASAERCSPLHSVVGFLRCFLTLSIEPALAACEIWEDFDRDVRSLNERYKNLYCDAYRDAIPGILDCLEDCPAELRQEILNQLLAAMAAMGC